MGLKPEMAPLEADGFKFEGPGNPLKDLFRKCEKGIPVRLGDQGTYTLPFHLLKGIGLYHVQPRPVHHQQPGVAVEEFDALGLRVYDGIQEPLAARQGFFPLDELLGH